MVRTSVSSLRQNPCLAYSAPRSVLYVRRKNRSWRPLNWRHRLGVNHSARRGKVRNDDKADWGAAWALFPGNIAYVWHGALHATTVADSLVEHGFTVRAQIIWAKERLVMSRGDWQSSGRAEQSDSHNWQVTEYPARSDEFVLRRVPIDRARLSCWSIVRDWTESGLAAGVPAMSAMSSRPNSRNRPSNFHAGCIDIGQRSPLTV